MYPNIVREILQYPDAWIITRQVTEKLEEEKKLRQHFYDTVSEEFKSEFINGEIIMHSPVKKSHNETNGLLFKLLDTFVTKHDLGFVGIEKILINLTRNDYEPDIVYFSKEKTQNFSKNQMLFPAPDFVVEILSETTAPRDRGIKFNDYAAHGIKEYWIIDTDEFTIDQYLITNRNKYQLKGTYEDGIITSEVIKGFKIPVRAIFYREENLKALAEILF